MAPDAFLMGFKFLKFNALHKQEWRGVKLAQQGDFLLKGFPNPLQRFTS